MTDFTPLWENQTFQNGDMTLRTARWPVENARGQILLLGGLRDFAEKYTLEARTFADWGFETVTLDWRHQGRSGRILGVDREFSHVDSFDDYLADLKVYWPTIKPTLAIAHSMGAHLALRFWAEQGITVPLVITAPLLGLKPNMSEGRARMIARAGIFLGQSRKLVPGQHPYARPLFEGNIYTNDRARFDETFEWMEHDSQVKKAGATYGWVQALFQSLTKLRNPDTLLRLKAPLLAFLTPNDPLVSGPAQEILTLVPNIQIIRLTSGRHEPLRETETVRGPVLAAIKNFSLNRPLQGI